MARTVVLVSGGVDSTVALCLLAAAGQPGLEAAYLKIWLEDEMAFLGRCPWDEDLGFVRQACAVAGVPLSVIPLQREYFDRVVAVAIAELRAGRTPSPDLLCNRRIKFGAFLDLVGPEVERVGSGHYARLREEAGGVALLRGADPVKDQTYFLSLLDQRQLGRAVFPVGGLRKAEVRALARRFGLASCERPDSQGICFLGRLRFADFVRFHLGERRGPIREVGSGRVLGEHPGYWFFTVGQRQGLGLSAGPWYVVSKEVEDNVVWVVHQARRADLARTSLVVESPHWIGARPADGATLEVRLRHGERLLGCRVALTSSAALAVTLEQPDSGIAPGQFAVLYDGERCLGGGAIAGAGGWPPVGQTSARPMTAANTSG
jgi:tRNA (5-methylaminomethyl-2-thiouridylate)-methyltransferase